MNTLQNLPYPSQVLTKETINDLPILAYTGEVLLVQTLQELTAALGKLREDDILGFDTEARPSFRKGRAYPTALIQLAGQHVVVLIRIALFPFSDVLAEVLAAPHIIKAGVAIRDDMRSLRKIHEFTPAGLADLAEMARQQHIQAQGLRTLAATLMGGRISKAAQCSNWEQKTLTLRQIRYAATDAWIGRELYLRLKKNECYLNN